MITEEKGVGWEETVDEEAGNWRRGNEVDRWKRG